MELIDVRCTTCGGHVSVEQNLKQAKCNSCRNTFLIKQAFELAQKEEYEILSVRKLNENLIRAVEVDDINSIEYFSNKILSIIPNDINALYYGSYAASKISSPNRLSEFYKSVDLDSTDEDLNSIIKHIVKHFELRDYEKIQLFFKNVFPMKLSQLEDSYNKKIQLEENYSQIERDIFICYSSLNQKLAEQITVQLENDGHSCWIGSRNLRPNDNKNYWENIAIAIENCTLFLLISSHDSMFSKDVQKEMIIAKRLRKKRLEYKIDESVHTTLFKQFFDGLKWINANNSYEESIKELKTRVVDLIIEDEQKIFQSAKTLEVRSDNQVKNVIKNENNSDLINSSTIKDVPRDEIDSRFPYIDTQNISIGFLKALNDIIFNEKKYQLELEEHEKEIQPKIFSIESQISNLKALKLTEKDYLSVSFFDDENEKNRKRNANEEIRLENNRIKKHNENIEKQIRDLKDKVFELKDHSIELLPTTIDSLEEYSLNDQEKDEISKLKEFSKELETANSEIQRLEAEIESEAKEITNLRNTTRELFIKNKFSSDYGTPSIKWIFQKTTLKYLNNDNLEREIYVNAVLGAIISSTMLILIFIILFISIYNAVTEYLLFAFIFMLLSVIPLMYYIYFPYKKMLEILEFKIRIKYDKKTSFLVKEKVNKIKEQNEEYSLRMETKKSELDEKLKPLKKKYQDFAIIFTDDNKIKDVANYFIEQGEANLNKLIRTFNLGFNTAKSYYIKLIQIGIISKYGDVLIAKDELDEYL